MWMVIFILFFGAGAAGAIYMCFAIGRFGLLRQISGGGLRFLASLLILAVCFGVICLLSSFVNAIVVLIHFTIFFLLSDLVFFFIRRGSGAAFTANPAGWTAIAVSVAYLLIAFFLCHHVWQTDYELTSDKLSEPVRIAMFADSHIGTTFDGEGFAEHIETIKAQAPDIVLIAGDFVDDDSKREDMVRACEALGGINAGYGVWYVYGNHDKSYYRGRDFSSEDLERELEKNKVHVMKDDIEYIGDLCIAGRKDASDNRRKTADELLEGVDPSKYIIMLDHQPGDYDNEARSKADLVVSGHTHGGQLIPITLVGEWIGMNDRTYGHEKRNSTDFIVTSGISDWAMDFKTGTKSEYVIIDVKSSR